MLLDKFKKGRFALSAVSLLASFTLLTGCISTTITSNSAGIKAQKYFNQQLLQTEKTGYEAKMKTSKSSGDFYEVSLDIKKDSKVIQEVKAFVTKGGKNIIFNPGAGELLGSPVLIYETDKSPVELSKSLKERKEKEALKNLPKSQKPNVKLFVMSGCPFGVKAEDVVAPVVAHLGSDLDIEVHYIVAKKFNKNDTRCFGNYCGMHGMMEAKENARQLCIAKESKEKFWAYVSAFNAECGINDKTDSCAAGVMSKVGVNSGSVASCMKDSDKIFDEEVKLTDKYTVNGSPTFVINDSKFDAPLSTSENLMKAICAAYSNAPKACSTSLGENNKVASAGGKCGN